jgi:hypothetical protein
VLTVVDGLKPSMLERAVATGRAPAMAAVMERGSYVDELRRRLPERDAGLRGDHRHRRAPGRPHIPSMNWYSRDERRYVEYGSSFSAVAALRARAAADRHDLQHERHAPAGRRADGVRVARRRRGAHGGDDLSDVPRALRAPDLEEHALTRLASTVFRRPVMGPKELFYADIFASRETPCRSQLGLPGIRDQHAGCVGAYLVEQDLFDFLLLSLPDNDTHSHRHGPHAQVTSIAAADRQLERLFHAGGGTDRFLDEHAVIVGGRPLPRAGREGHRAAGRLRRAAPCWRPSGLATRDAEIAVVPGPAQRHDLRAAPRGPRHARPADRRDALAIDGVDLALWRPAPREGAIANGNGELRFAPGGDVRDGRGGRWSIDGPLDVLDARVQDGVLRSEAYPTRWVARGRR